MVLLNQRIYYEKLSQGEMPATQLEALEFAHGSGITNSGAVATVEVSNKQFYEAATQTDFKSERGDADVELG